MENEQFYKKSPRLNRIFNNFSIYLSASFLVLIFVFIKYVKLRQLIERKKFPVWRAYLYHFYSSLQYLLIVILSTPLVNYLFINSYKFFTADIVHCR